MDNIQKHRIMLRVNLFEKTDAFLNDPTDSLKAHQALVQIMRISASGIVAIEGAVEKAFSDIEAALKENNVVWAIRLEHLSTVPRYYGQTTGRTTLRPHECSVNVLIDMARKAERDDSYRVIPHVRS